MAFRFCLIDRWFEFEFENKSMNKKSESSSIVAKKISIPKCDKPNFITIYEYLKTIRYYEFNLNFSILDELINDQDDLDDSYSVINETIAPTQQNSNQDDGEDFYTLTQRLKTFCVLNN